MWFRRLVSCTFEDAIEAMKTINELKSTMPQIGQLDWIGLRSKRRGEIHLTEQVEVSEDAGLVGDHYSKSGGKRMVTLIQHEHLKTVGGILGNEIDPKLCRRNLVVSGINLNALQDAQFQIGQDVILEGTGYCHPCSRMEENLGPGGYNAMRGHGGINARVIRGGKIQKGDKITFRENPG